MICQRKRRNLPISKCLRARNIRFSVGSVGPPHQSNSPQTWRRRTVVVFQGSHHPHPTWLTWLKQCHKPSLQMLTRQKPRNGGKWTQIAGTTRCDSLERSMIRWQEMLIDSTLKPKYVIGSGKSLVDYLFLVVKCQNKWNGSRGFKLKNAWQKQQCLILWVRCYPMFENIPKWKLAIWLHTLAAVLCEMQVMIAL